MNTGASAGPREKAGGGAGAPFAETRSQELPGAHADLRVLGLCKSFSIGRGDVEIFRDLSFTVADGEMVAVIGESGAGKSSLLHLLAALDTPSAGEIWYGAVRVDRLRAGEGARFRNREIGYVWQFHYLLPEFLAWENVAMPLLARDGDARDARRRAEALLEEVGLGARSGHRAGELSGGEQQRVSIARALVTEPRLLLADEPTGDLDERTAGVVFTLLRQMHARRGLTTVLVTHNTMFAGRCDRVLRLREGRLEETREPATPTPEHPGLEI